MKVYVVVTIAGTGDDDVEIYGDVVLVTPNKKTALSAVRSLDRWKKTRTPFMHGRIKELTGLDVDSLYEFSSAQYFEREMRD